ncbi:MAG: DUF3306 domain-containing protein [Pseudomonadota bacterium]
MKDDGFLGRWSARKAAARAGDLEEAPEVASEPQLAPSTDETVAADGPSDEELSDAELLEKYELPDPDGMAAGDDFSAFMKDGVPARLRNRALRKLWISNPALANLDELLDYGEDFTDAATVVENLQTLYQVGRGFMRDEDYAEREETEEEADDLAADAPSPDPEEANDAASESPGVGLAENGSADQDAPASTALETERPVVANEPVDMRAAAAEFESQNTPVGRAARPARRMAFQFKKDVT